MCVFVGTYIPAAVYLQYLFHIMVFAKFRLCFGSPIFILPILKNNQLSKIKTQSEEYQRVTRKSVFSIYFRIS